MHLFAIILNTIISTLAIVVIILIILRAEGKIQGTRGILDAITAGVSVGCLVVQGIVVFIIDIFYEIPEGYTLQPAAFFVVLSGVFYLFGHSHWDKRETKEERRDYE